MSKTKKNVYFIQFNLAQRRSLNARLNVKTVHFEQFSLALLYSFVLFDLYIELYQILPLRAWMDLGVMAMKGHSHSQKLHYNWSFTIRLFRVINRALVFFFLFFFFGGGSYLSVEKWSVYFPTGQREGDREITRQRLHFGGARGVVVIAVGNEHGDTSSNPERDWLHFT